MLYEDLFSEGEDGDAVEGALAEMKENFSIRKALSDA
jgi:hypothetical protein